MHISEEQFQALTTFVHTGDDNTKKAALEELAKFVLGDDLYDETAATAGRHAFLMRLSCEYACNHNNMAIGDMNRVEFSNVAQDAFSAMKFLHKNIDAFLK